MKRFRSIWSLGATLALLPTMAWSAANIVVNFQGSFVAPTCNFAVNGGRSTNIGTYPNTYFNTNTSTPVVQIPIVATGCTTGINTIHLRFSGAADSSNNQLFAVNPGSSVTGVGVELLYNAQSTRIQPGSTVNWVGVDPSQPTSTWNFWARFYKTTGTIGAGSINVPITINFTYN
ncbi:fimbrial protein [Dyella sp. GSA-30]|uniref:fimbrial protein n=1 Tax=Dyella sp. GSA-30 TaxID=2994496 RepID=UPI0024904AAF|nr:fimbrial protein [Dyella sp. GSA-30]